MLLPGETDLNRLHRTHHGGGEIITLTKLFVKEKKKSKAIALWAVYSTILLAIIVLLIRRDVLFLLPNSILLISFLFTQAHLMLRDIKDKNKWVIFGLLWVFAMVSMHIWAYKINHVSTYIAVGIGDFIYIKIFDKIINF